MASSSTLHDINEEATNIEEEARRAARKRAIDRLAEDLQSPDQLSKVRSRMFFIEGAPICALRCPSDDTVAFGNLPKLTPSLSGLLGRTNQV